NGMPRSRGIGSARFGPMNTGASFSNRLKPGWQRSRSRIPPRSPACWLPAAPHDLIGGRTLSPGASRWPCPPPSTRAARPRSHGGRDRSIRRPITAFDIEAWGRGPRRAFETLLIDGNTSMMQTMLLLQRRNALQRLLLPCEVPVLTQRSPENPEDDGRRL